MILRMAWRNIWRNKTRSLVIIASVMIGLFAGFFVLSLYKGMMKGRIRTVIDSEVGHIQFHDSSFQKDYDPVFRIGSSDELLSSLLSDSQVLCFATRSVTQGMIATVTGSAGVQINGIIPKEENRVSHMDKKIIEGKDMSPEKKHEVLIGKKLAKKLKLKCGNKLVLTFTDTASNLVSAAFRVSGIYESENAPRDEKNVYIEQNELNELLSVDGAVHEISLILKKDEMTLPLRDEWRKKYPSLLVESWMDISPETRLMADTVDTMSLIIIVIILFALAFGIINTMLMAVLERVREIGMMMALGFNKWRLLKLILLETVILTLAGAPPGILISRIVIDRLHATGMVFSQAGKEMMSSFGFSRVIYPEFPAEKLIMILSVVLGTALISCIFPVWKALRLEPSEALRK